MTVNILLFWLSCSVINFIRLCLFYRWGKKFYATAWKPQRAFRDLTLSHHPNLTLACWVFGGPVSIVPLLTALRRNRELSDSVKDSISKLFTPGQAVASTTTTKEDS